ncbi:hypothetical protein CFR71_11915 [Novacetimonas pomaceti]|uniref:Uncharacterized protein n=2 Tax=Novacetimonas pomaceti TaxID=2021998 RepID=A0A318QBQ5_9PROT|nr:hypothetical protein CFR71_11915 [Novacetimonas pomaceti]
MQVMTHNHFRISGGQIWTPLSRGVEKRIVLDCPPGQVGFVTDLQPPSAGVVYETLNDFQEWVMLHEAAALQWD